jgi:formamidase
MNTGALKALAAAVVFAGVAATGHASDRHGKRIVIPKNGERCINDPKCHNRWHYAIPPVAKADPGDVVVFGTRDAFDHSLDRNSTAADVVALNLNLVHPLTGPLYVRGAKAGDVLAVTLLDIEPDDFGYTIVVPGFGFLRDVFTEPFIVRWDLSRRGATSRDMRGVNIRFDGFMGTIGVAPGPAETERFFQREAELAAAGGVVLQPQPLDALPTPVCGVAGSHRDRCLRTIPPRENGGTMDVKQMQVGTTLLLPCFIEGCGLFAGDVHFAQGDGEVSGTAIEMGARVTVRVDVREGAGAAIKSPEFEGDAQLKTIAPSQFYATVGLPLKSAGEVPIYVTYIDGEKIGPLTNLSEDLTLAARNALIGMIDYMVREHGLEPKQAYVVASVAADLRVSQVVDVPNFIVSAFLPLEIFSGGE